MGKMITVEHEDEARFFLQRAILRILSIAATLYTSKELDNPPNGRFWTISPDGDVQRRFCVARRVAPTYSDDFRPEVTVWAAFVDLESEFTCGMYKTPGLPGSPTLAATPITSSGRRIASELEELRFALQCLATLLSVHRPSRRASSPCAPRREDGRWLCSFNRGGLRSLKGLAPGIVSIAKRVPGSDRA